jgi:RNA polymerase sigma-70 factor (ECF subfamily)
MNITEILRKIHAGDRHAFAEVVTQYQRPLFGFLGRMGLSQGLAEEVAQETFLRAWRNLGQYNAGRGQFSTWLFTIAKNLAINELARATNERAIPVGEATPEPPCDQPQPPEAIALRQRRQLLHDALQQLSVEERSAVALAYIADFELAEIARIENCTTGAIKTRLHRARRKLFNLLEHKNA